jgi:hypothetical protein
LFGKKKEHTGFSYSTYQIFLLHNVLAFDTTKLMVRA